MHFIAGGPHAARGARRGLFNSGCRFTRAGPGANFFYVAPLIENETYKTRPDTADVSALKRWITSSESCCPAPREGALVTEYHYVTRAIVRDFIHDLMNYRMH
ncbi:hypothetical protein EVAR_24766_1 [Eumeta japonica]|uniref:Uncharacterized protein n=1 Tax=Eumeta variegata TaxID=151549 RepID=A0A4C1VDQ8_EUMVA|nr:hypothetical protein EVAR_24766_1 [Eumeta japonica]